MSRNCMCGIGSTYIYICNHSIPRALYLVCYCLVSSNALYGIATKYTYICNASIPRALYRVSSTCMNSVGTEYIYMKYLFIYPAARKRKPSHGQVPRFPEPAILDQLCVFLYPRCSMTELPLTGGDTCLQEDISAYVYIFRLLDSQRPLSCI